MMKKQKRCLRTKSTRVKFNRLVTAKVLQHVSSSMLPFYRAIANNQKFAGQWTRAVIKADLARMQKLLHLVSPYLSRQGMGCNAIGYFISFSFTKPIVLYTNGITIPPGSVQFFFETHVHRVLACCLLPFYQKLSINQTYALALARAIRANDRAKVNHLVRACVKTPALKSVAIQDSGLALSFKYPFSKYTYRLYLFREVY